MDEAEHIPEKVTIKGLAKRHGLSAAFLFFAVFRIEVAQEKTQDSVSEMSVSLGILIEDAARQAKLLRDHTADIKDHEARLIKLETQPRADLSRSINSEE